MPGFNRGETPLQVRNEVHPYGRIGRCRGPRTAVVVLDDPFFERAPQFMDRRITRHDGISQLLLLPLGFGLELCFHLLQLAQSLDVSPIGGTNEV